jgi:hypothetical protein
MEICLRSSAREGLANGKVKLFRKTEGRDIDCSRMSLRSRYIHEGCCCINIHCTANENLGELPIQRKFRLNFAGSTGQALRRGPWKGISKEHRWEA